MGQKKRVAYISQNLAYLLRSRGETQVSLCDSTGLNRTTIYNILDGRVINLHHNTIRKVSDFFGVSYVEIETLDLAEKEKIDASISFDGNKNPLAVPIIKQSECLLPEIFNKPIGNLIMSHNVTYYFGEGTHILAVLIENRIDKHFNAGDLIIIKRGHYVSDFPKLVYNRSHALFTVQQKSCNNDDVSLTIVGDILEERYHYGK